MVGLPRVGSASIGGIAVQGAQRAAGDIVVKGAKNQYT
jgi:hypothetical protein